MSGKARVSYLEDSRPALSGRLPEGQAKRDIENDFRSKSSPYDSVSRFRASTIQAHVSPSYEMALPPSLAFLYRGEAECLRDKPEPRVLGICPGAQSASGVRRPAPKKLDPLRKIDGRA